MKKDTFIQDNFLLQNEAAEKLYQDYAAKQPIIDYHNHLPPKDIAEDRSFENITQVWLYGDHYKWRAMRTLGIDEKYITGDASDKEKFLGEKRKNFLPGPKQYHIRCEIRCTIGRTWN